MKVSCLASSSAGNCYILELTVKGNPTYIMVECGLPYSKILQRCNENQILLNQVECCLVTHAHKDHCIAAKDLTRKGIEICATKDTLSLINVKGKELVIDKPNKITTGVYVLPFEVEHDIVGAVGFVIKTEDETIIFVNDHKRWTKSLANFRPDFVFIECNYDHKVVYAQLYELEKKEFKTSEDLLKIHQHERNLNAHCSLKGTIKGLSKLNLENCKAIFLMHLSDRYANEYRMKNEVQKATGIMTYVAGKNGGIK